MSGWKKLQLRNLDLECLNCSTAAENVEHNLSPTPRNAPALPTRAAESQSSTCVTCGITFPSFLQQREHFKSDWHRKNVQRRTRGRPVISEDKFECLSDISSISGSDDEESDNEGEEENNGSFEPLSQPKKGPRVEFKDPSGKGGYLVLWRCALPDFESLGSLKRLGIWVIVLCGGGHFSGVVFDKGGEILAHQSFHRYTTRKKQGGSQSAADGVKGGGSKARSAGATLRRYGEESLRREVRETITKWNDWINEAQVVYLQASGRSSRDMLYGFAESPFSVLSGSVVRTIPFSTRRPTLSEAKRVFSELSTVIRAPESQVPQVREKPKPVSLTKSGQPAKVASAAKIDSSAKTKKTDHLKKREPTPSKDEAAKNSLPEEQPAKEIDAKLAAVYDACCIGDLNLVRDALAGYMDEESRLDPLNYVYHPGYGAKVPELSGVCEDISLVTVGAILGNNELVWWLLDAGADPNVGAQPYPLAKSKKIRTTLRRYWAENPEKYDYAAAGIPSLLTKEMLEKQNEKERQKRKREREKRKVRLKTLKEEELEKKKPKHVKARELRAKAAEERMAKMAACGSKCDMCGSSLVNKTPFERLQYKYCSVDCVQGHKRSL